MLHPAFPPQQFILHELHFAKKPKTIKHKFTLEEDKQLIELVGNEKYPNWQQIANSIPGKTCRQCRDRYNHYLAPGLSREPWSEQEDQLIINLYKIYGPNWSLIAGHFQNKRTNNGIKNRFNNHLKKRMMEIGSCQNNTIEEDSQDSFQFFDLFSGNEFVEELLF